MTISFCHCRWVFLSFGRKKSHSASGRRKSILLRQSRIIWPWNCDKFVDRSFVSNFFHRFSLKWRIWNWVNCTLSNFDRSDFHELNKDFLLHSIRLTRKQVRWLICVSNPMFDIRMKRTFCYSKKKRFVYKAKYLTIRQNLSSDNERLGLISDEQDNENVTRRLFIAKERTMSSEREIDVRSSDWCVHWSNSIFSILFSFSNSLSMIEMFKLSVTSWCFNALLNNAAPSSLMLFPSKWSIVHCFCWNVSWMTREISFEVSFMLQ